MTTERIIQLSRKKLSLDHLIIQKMNTDGEDEEEDVDVESILKYGAENKRSVGSRDREEALKPKIIGPRIG